MESLRRITEPRNPNSNRDRRPAAGKAASEPAQPTGPLSSLRLFSSPSLSSASPTRTKMVSPAFVLLPLYIYPNLHAWDAVYTSIRANPNQTFIIIINPDNGPGPQPYPDAKYIAGIAQLNNFTNTHLLGYVYTSTAQRSQAQLQADIDRYAGWRSYVHAPGSPPADMHLDGIFFDETASTYTAAAYANLSAAAQHVRSVMPVGHQRVFFNPGVVPDARFYALADSTTVFENNGAAFGTGPAMGAALLAALPTQYRAKTNVIIHGFGGSLTAQIAVIREVVVTGGLGGLFVSDSKEYDRLSSVWSAFCSEMAAVT